MPEKIKTDVNNAEASSASDGSEFSEASPELAAYLERAKERDGLYEKNMNRVESYRNNTPDDSEDDNSDDNDSDDNDSDEEEDDESEASLNTDEEDKEESDESEEDEELNPDDESAESEKTQNNKDQGKGKTKKLPETVPYIEHQKARQVIKQERERAEQLQSQLNEINEAGNLGLTPQQYNQAKQDAQKYQYPDVPSFIDAVRVQQQLEAETERIAANDELSDEIKRTLIETKQEAAATKQERIKAQAINQKTNLQIMNSQISEKLGALLKDIGVTEDQIDPEFLAVLRDTPPNMLDKIAPGLKKLVKKQADNENIKRIAEKQKRKAVPSPESRGGKAVAPASAKVNPKSVKNMSWGSVVKGFGIKR